MTLRGRLIVASLAVAVPLAGALLVIDDRVRGQDQLEFALVFEAVPGRPVRDVRSIPLTKGMPLKELRGRLDEVLARAGDLGDAHVRVTLQVDAPEPGLAQRVKDQVPVSPVTKSALIACCTGRCAVSHENGGLPW